MSLVHAPRMLETCIQILSVPEVFKPTLCILLRDYPNHSAMSNSGEGEKGTLSILLLTLSIMQRFTGLGLERESIHIHDSPACCWSWLLGKEVPVSAPTTAYHMTGSNAWTAPGAGPGSLVAYLANECSNSNTKIENHAHSCEISLCLTQSSPIKVNEFSSIKVF